MRINARPLSSLLDVQWGDGANLSQSCMLILLSEDQREIRQSSANSALLSPVLRTRASAYE